MNLFECRGCHTPKPLEEFVKDPSRKRGHRTRCKSCEKTTRYKSQDTEKPKNKKCSTCRETKDACQFSKSSRSKSGLRSQCHHCEKLARPTRTEEIRRVEKDRTLRKSFGLTIEQYEVLERAQEGVCYICKRPNPHGWRLSVDHCHTTGKIRTLLCHSCNTSLGHLAEDLDILKNFTKYLGQCIEMRTEEEPNPFYDEMDPATQAIRVPHSTG